MLRQQSCGQPRVLPELLQPARAPGVPADLLDLVQTAELESGHSAGLAVGHPLLAVVVDQPLEVVAQLGVELVLELGAVKQPSPPAHRALPADV